MWAVQAAQAPSHLVWQLKHGDVLIAPLENNTPVSAQHQEQTVVASAKTLQQLQTPVTHSTKMNDPWLHEDPSQSMSKKKEVSTHQVAAIEAAVEQKIMAKLKPEDV